MFGRNKPDPQTAYEMVEQAVGKKAAKDLKDSLMEAPSGRVRRMVVDANAERMRRDRDK